MRTTIFRLAAIFGLLIGALAFGTAVSADTGNGAVQGFAFCGIATPGYGSGVVDATDAHYVVTPSGNATLTCHGQLPAGSPTPTSAVVIKDIPCSIPNGGGYASDSQVVITPSGDVLLTCHAKA